MLQDFRGENKKIKKVLKNQGTRVSEKAHLY